MEINKYIEKLKKYVGVPFRCETKENILRVYADNEVYYDYVFSKGLVEKCERGNMIEVGSWSSTRIADLKFAMLVYNIANKKNDDKLPRELEFCDSLESLRNVFNTYVKDNNYAIGSIQDGKISIIKGEEYTVLFSQNGKEYVIESDSDCEFIFGRFYYEVLYLNSFLDSLKRYESIFDEKITNEEIIDVIGY